MECHGNSWTRKSLAANNKSMLERSAKEQITEGDGLFVQKRTLSFYSKSNPISE